MPILIIKPKLLSSPKKKELAQGGYIIIETDNPSDITILDETIQLSGNILLETALEALGHGNDTTARQAFGKLIRERMLEKIKKAPTR